MNTPIPFSDSEFVKSFLIEEIECGEQWRREKAVEYPEDKRNLACAEALSRLAEAIKALPATSGYFARLYRLWQIDESLDEGQEILREAISRYGFDGTVTYSAQEWLQQLTEDLERIILR
jgi:hypothetical protein